MTTLLMVLRAPLQAWGDSSRFARRETRAIPTKSGVIGLLAAAEGRRRTDPLEDLVGLRFGVRADQPGRLLRDFQTARPKGAKHSGLSNRYYLSDAAFLAGVEGDQSLVRDLAERLCQPAFPLFLGRRSCPPAGPIHTEIVEAGLIESLRQAQWHAATWYRRRLPAGEVALRLVADADVARAEGQMSRSPGSTASSEETKAAADFAVELVRDVPVSFSSVRREYVWREVAELAHVRVDNRDGYRPEGGVDWLAEVREA